MGGRFWWDKRDLDTSGVDVHLGGGDLWVGRQGRRDPRSGIGGEPPTTVGSEWVVHKSRLGHDGVVQEGESNPGPGVSWTARRGGVAGEGLGGEE